jgi:hypothetical protein
VQKRGASREIGRRCYLWLRMNKGNPIDPTKPRRPRGDTDPTHPGELFYEYQRETYTDGTIYYREKWLTPDKFAAARNRHAADRAKHKGTHLGNLRKLRDGRRYHAIAKGDEFHLSMRDVIEMYPVDGRCPVFGLTFTRDGGRASATIHRIANERRIYDRQNCEIVSRSYNSCVQDKTFGGRVAHARKAPRDAVTLEMRATAGAHLDAMRKARGCN